jgi:hypothetical protein
MSDFYRSFYAGRNDDHRIPALLVIVLGQRVDHINTCRFKMTPVMSSDYMAVKQGRCRNQGILAGHGAISGFQIS